MAKRDQFGGAFGCLDSGNLCNRQDVALGDLVFFDHISRRHGHFEGAGGASHPPLQSFLADVDHVRSTLVIHMGEITHVNLL